MCFWVFLGGVFGDALDWFDLCSHVGVCQASQGRPQSPIIYSNLTRKTERRGLAFEIAEDVSPSAQVTC